MYSSLDIIHVIIYYYFIKKGGFMMDNIGTRLTTLRESLKETKASFAASIKISPQRLHNYETGKRNIPQDILDRLKKMYRVNLEWLLYGIDDMFIAEGKLQYPLLEQKVSAGMQAVIFDDILDKPSRYLSVSRDILGRHANEKAFFMIVVGNSMEPKIKNGDLIASVRISHPEMINDTYVIRYNGIMMVKNIQWLSPTEIIIISENKIYEPIRIRLNENQTDFAILGKVIFHGEFY